MSKLTPHTAVSDEANKQLLSRLEAFELDDPNASFTFSQRLARENGWTHEFALRVIDEYKRFVYLAMTAGHEVTPSDEVDQAWHLHLTYTRSYWEEMCGQLLGKPLHHGPTKGGEAEGVRFEDQYERTFASYRDAFGEEPPTDIWPPAETRFGEAPYFVRVNTRRQKVSKRRRPQPVMLGGLAAVGLFTAVPLANADEEFVYWIIVYVVIGLAVTWLLKAILRAATGGRWGNGGSGYSGCSSFFGGCGGDSGCGSSCGGGCGGGCGG